MMILEADITFGSDRILTEKEVVEDTWSATQSSNFFNYAIIEIEAEDIISDNSDLVHRKLLHSIGNILGIWRYTVY